MAINVSQLKYIVYFWLSMCHSWNISYIFGFQCVTENIVFISMCHSWNISYIFGYQCVTAEIYRIFLRNISCFLRNAYYFFQSIYSEECNVYVIWNDRTKNFLPNPNRTSDLFSPNRNQTELLCIWFTLVPTQVDENARWMS